MCKSPESAGLILHLEDAEATAALGQALVAALPHEFAGWCVLLAGDLGAGKSTLARAMLRAMGHEGPVPSPTYTLVEPYEVAGNIVYHIDLYRIVEEDELHFLALRDLEDGLSLVEWPERAPQLAARADLRIALSVEDNGRTAALSGINERGSELLGRLQLPDLG